MDSKRIIYIHNPKFKREKKVYFKTFGLYLNKFLKRLHGKITIVTKSIGNVISNHLKLDFVTFLGILFDLKKKNFIKFSLF